MISSSEIKGSCASSPSLLPFMDSRFMHLGRTAYASRVRNSQKPSTQNNKDVSTASSPSSQRRIPLPHQSPRLRVGKTIQKRRVPSGRSVCSCVGVKPQLKHLLPGRGEGRQRRKEDEDEKVNRVRRKRSFQSRGCHPYVTCISRVYLTYYIV